MLQRKVTEAKALRLTCAEYFFGKTLPALGTLPFIGLTGLVTVPANTAIAVFRYGKLDALITQPGLTWLAPGYTDVRCFTGTQTHKMDEIHVVDAMGNPIIVRALLEFSVDDPAALHIATNSSTAVLINQAEQVVREACTRLPLLGERGHDIRSQTHEIGAAMLADLQPDASVFGVVVQRLVIVEARYAPEIASQMLLKQQAQSTVNARKEIVLGALNIVRDTLNEFPQLSAVARENLVGNLLVTLTSHQPAHPVLALA